MKKHATTIVLLLLAIALGVWLWMDRNAVSVGERKRRENNAFVAWRKDEISRVEIAHEDETIVLARDPKSDAPWRLTSPRDERADTSAVERLLTTLEFATAVRKPSEGVDLGLEAPRATGSIVMGALVVRFAVGAPSPRPEGSSYFRVEGESPIVISKELTDTLLQRADAYRDRTVVPYLSLDLARFEVTRPGGGFSLERMDERSFRVAEVGVAASRDALDSVWSALAEMRAESFPKDADADRLTASPRLTITMRPSDGTKRPAVLVIGDACPGQPADVVVLRKEPSRVAACAPKGVIDALSVTPDALADKKPFSLRADEIQELRLEGSGAKPIEIARKGSGFHEREPADRDLAPEEVDAANELLAHVEKTEAESVARGGGAPFEAAFRARVRAGSREETVEIGAPNADGKVPLHRLRDDARLVVSRLAARRLVPRDTTLASRVLLGDTRRVTRVLVACGVRQELVDDGSGLHLVSPQGYETDASVHELVDALTRGRIDEWIADRDDGTFGLASEACRVVLSFADGNAPASIRFGAESDGSVFGTIEGRDHVFSTNRSLRDLASKIYVSRAALRVLPDAYDRVRVTIGGKPVEPHEPQAAKDALATLYADEVRSLGAPDVGKVELEIDAGTKKIRCGPADARGMRACATPAVKAVFAVASSRFAALFAGDASTGPR